MPPPPPPPTLLLLLLLLLLVAVGAGAVPAWALYCTRLFYTSERRREHLSINRQRPVNKQAIYRLVIRAASREPPRAYRLSSIFPFDTDARGSVVSYFSPSAGG